MAEPWTVRNERGSRFALRLMRWIVLRFGRRAGRLVLHPIVIYFLLSAPKARRASRNYLARVLPHPPRWRDTYRHLYEFASVALDRIYLFGPQIDQLAITTHGVDAFRDHLDRGQGIIVITAHLGSFEALRALGGWRRDLKVRVLMNREGGPKVNAAIESINPGIADHIIDTSVSDVDRVLKVKAALDRGEIVGLMADRYEEGERTADCDFLGEKAPFPLAPWLFAGILGAPVLLTFGLYRGGNRYELYCEEFSPALHLPRAHRSEQAADCAQAYADRLAAHVRMAPYNWFNFYDFWH